jgi:hypothetical protein
MSLSEADRTTLGCRKLRLYGYTIILDRKRAVVVLSRFSCVDVWEFYGGLVNRRRGDGVSQSGTVQHGIHSESYERF